MRASLDCKSLPLKPTSLMYERVVRYQGNNSVIIHCPLWSPEPFGVRELACASLPFLRFTLTFLMVVLVSTYTHEERG